MGPGAKLRHMRMRALWGYRGGDQRPATVADSVQGGVLLALLYAVPRDGTGPAFSVAIKP